MSNQPHPTLSDAANDAFQRLEDSALADEWRKPHLYALAACLDADRGLPYNELTDATGLSGRQTKRVIRDLEDADLVERRVSTADYNRHVFSPVSP